MGGMYPDNQEIEVFGERVVYPGVDPETGKFTNGSFTNPMIKPSFIPAETINLIIDNLESLIRKCGGTPDTVNTAQIANLLASAAVPLAMMLRDTAGRAKVAAPVEDDDIARKFEVDEAYNTLNKKINQYAGLGGSIPTTNLSANPTQKALFAYFAGAIWGTGGETSWDATMPNNSTYTLDGIVYLITDIYNGTWVHNSYDGHRWVFNNTPPAQVDFVDVGFDTVSIANPVAAGLVKAGGDIGVAADGAVEVKPTRTFALAENIEKFTSGAAITFNAFWQSVMEKINGIITKQYNVELSMKQGGYQLRVKMPYKRTEVARNEGVSTTGLSTTWIADEDCFVCFRHEGLDLYAVPRTYSMLVSVHDHHTEVYEVDLKRNAIWEYGWNARIPKGSRVAFNVMRAGDTPNINRRVIIYKVDAEYAPANSSY